jgi:hypothetical protein
MPVCAAASTIPVTNQCSTSTLLAVLTSPHDAQISSSFPTAWPLVHLHVSQTTQPFAGKSCTTQQPGVAHSHWLNSLQETTANCHNREVRNLGTIGPFGHQRRHIHSKQQVKRLSERQNQLGKPGRTSVNGEDDRCPRYY